jgi:hypothetical protein
MLARGRGKTRLGVEESGAEGEDVKGRRREEENS